MRRQSLLLVVFVSALAAAEPPSESKVAPAKASPQVTRMSGPYTHSNLTLFLMHGPDILKDRKFLTLDEALEQKKIVVHETSEVNELTVENTSADIEIYINTGDIVKGGKQDRLMAVDMIVPPKSGKIPVPSFCVEAGRWAQRGGEAAGQFSSAKAQANNDVKRAVNTGYNQSDVWNRVKQAQEKLAKNVGREVTSSVSPSSLQLTLEDKALLEKLAGYRTSLESIIKENRDVIGLAVVINGKVDAADVYASSSLFAKLWPQLLQSACVDALAEFDTKKKFEVPSAKAVEAFLAAAAAAPAKEMQPVAAGMHRQTAANPQGQQNANLPPRQTNEIQGGAARPVAELRVRIVRQEAKDSVLVECRDKKGEVVLHRSYLRK